ncbi:MAG: Bax inhibitor-1/YccA family protein [Gracilimonas sp.]|uniref:Bax inhibitor-1/YccA family protein n=1 Tax=Gracilimonas TaxID=649462 RepID=UPI001B236DE3|nr:Bax inhibitor-1/YccA family protein [Gracilimonas sp.]MBO6586015.1 Bax inhibitor-1/YccA family protein [Gracilimonas sp.]MBO6617012.1 Bax inhibitor-1/YccA family protein [Gracilimonas sp.]
MNTQHLTAEQVKSIQSSFINKVYGWMALALAITGFVALRVVDSGFVETMAQNQILFFGIIIAELGLVVWLSGRINSMNASMAIGLFLLYSALNGLTFSILFLVYTSASIASTFFITAGTFGVTSAYGYFTKKDLSSIGNIAFMGLIGIIIATVVNIFVHSEMLYWGITYIGVLVFVGLTAYDTQKMKKMSLEVDVESEEGSKGAIMGALALYLDFINMFIFLLRIFGDRR